MTDLFTYRYPETAGQKGGGASLEAAAKITESGGKGRLERLVMDLFAFRPAWTPDEAALYLDLHPSDIRPRFSELCLEKRSKNGELMRPALIRKTDEKRKSNRGNSQHVYERLPES